MIPKKVHYNTEVQRVSAEFLRAFTLNRIEQVYGPHDEQTIENAIDSAEAVLSAIYKRITMDIVFPEVHMDAPTICECVVHSKHGIEMPARVGNHLVFGNGSWRTLCCGWSSRVYKAEWEEWMAAQGVPIYVPSLLDKHKNTEAANASVSQDDAWAWALGG